MFLFASSGINCASLIHQSLAVLMGTTLMCSGRLFTAIVFIISEIFRLWPFTKTMEVSYINNKFQKKVVRHFTARTVSVSQLTHFLCTNAVYRN